LTDQTLSKERNYFLAGFFIQVGIGVVFRLCALSAPPESVEGVQGLGAVLTVVAKAVFVYLVLRLSRFLRQPVWLTILYCVLAPFSLLYLIPFIGLLAGVKNARRVVVSGASGANRAPQEELSQ
jgi:hypothetical protein